MRPIHNSVLLDVISAGGLILINVCIINGASYILQAGGRPGCPCRRCLCPTGLGERMLGHHGAGDGDETAAAPGAGAIMALKS